jgi:hypothetical protein
MQTAIMQPAQFAVGALERGQIRRGKTLAIKKLDSQEFGNIGGGAHRMIS